MTPIDYVAMTKVPDLVARFNRCCLIWETMDAELVELNRHLRYRTMGVGRWNDETGSLLRDVIEEIRELAHELAGECAEPRDGVEYRQTRLYCQAEDEEVGYDHIVPIASIVYVETTFDDEENEVEHYTVLFGELPLCLWRS